MQVCSEAVGPFPCAQVMLLGGTVGLGGQDLPALPSPYLCPADAVLESFDNHPPIVLPSSGFKVDLEVETLDDNIYRHLLYIRHFLWSLQSKSPHGSEGPCSAPPKVREHFFSEGAVRCWNREWWGHRPWRCSRTARKWH